MSHVLIIVELAQVEAANNYAREWDPEGGENTFGLLKLGMDGEDPTHTGCCTSVTPSQRAMIAAGIGNERWATVKNWRKEDSLEDHLLIERIVRRADRDPLEIAEDEIPGPGDRSGE